MREKRITIE